jgi:hypothetical protein
MKKRDTEKREENFNGISFVPLGQNCEKILKCGLDGNRIE